jgi:protein ImuA
MTQPQKSRAEVVAELREKLEALESSLRNPAGESDIIRPTGVAPLNALLPEGGFRGGSLVEWLAEEDGAGVVTLALHAARPWLASGQTCLVVDDSQRFYPLAAAALGIGLEQLLIVRPTARDLFWTLEQVLRCRGVAVTVGWFGPAADRVLRRLQLAAETGGGIGILLRPAAVRTQPTWAQLRLLVRAVPGGAGGRRLGIEVLYGQGGKAGGTVEVDLDDETGNVRLAAPLAAPGDARQAT